MENPQAENGHIDIANEIAEKFGCYHLSGNEWMVLWVVLRKTWGWHKKTDEISLTQFEKLTKLSRFRVSESINNLVTKGLLVKNKEGFINVYGFNKHYSQWTSNEKVTSNEKETGVVTKTVPVTSNENRTHKRKDTKEKRERETALNKTMRYLLEIPEEDISTLKAGVDVSNEQIRSKAEDLHNYCLAKGKKYSDYHALLRNALKRDFPKSNYHPL